MPFSCEREGGLSVTFCTVFKMCQHRVNAVLDIRILISLQHGQSGDRAKALDIRVNELTKENEVLKMELLSTNEILDEVRRKHEEQTISNENKIQILG